MKVNSTGKANNTIHFREAISEKKMQPTKNIYSALLWLSLEWDWVEV